MRLAWRVSSQTSPGGRGFVSALSGLVRIALKVQRRAMQFALHRERVMLRGLKTNETHHQAT
jgi:hypothetical protein